jgi:hypothetical protein
MEKFKLLVSYSTLALFEPELELPFNDWGKAQWKQGFAWREESVSFATLNGFGWIDIELVTADQVTLKPESQRAILVPFKVPESGLVEISGTNQGKVISLARGNYALVYETASRNEDEMWCRLTFIPTSEPVEPQILKADPLLSPQYPLLMEAVTA